jgi:hypothetical protein
MSSKMVTPKETSPYKASLTRRQFLFYEMRTTARLMASGLSDQEITKQVLENNLFQYPTEKSLRDLSAYCIQQLRALDESLIKAVAEGPLEDAKQICLYAMMKQSRLVYDFMVGVIGEKYRQQDYSFERIDINSFFFRLQEQDSVVATWSETTINKLKQVLVKILVETGYLSSTKSTSLNLVFLNSTLRKSIEIQNDLAMLPAFNSF